MKKLTYREPSIKLKQSSVTTSSSLPKISDILPAIHLDAQPLSVRLIDTRPHRDADQLAGGRINSLFHDLQVHLGHVNLLVELGREFGALEQLRVHA